jgi:hypothetical protein
MNGGRNCLHPAHGNHRLQLCESTVSATASHRWSRS